MANTVGLLIVSVFVVSGYRKGLAAVILGMVGVVTAYIAALKLAMPVGDLMRWLGLASGISAYFVAGAAVFSLVGLVFYVPGFFLRRRTRRLREEGNALLWAQITAAVLNGVIGVAYAMVAVWMLMMIRDARQTQSEVRETSGGRPVFERLSSSVAKGLATVIDRDGQDSQLASQFAQDPGKVARHSKAILENPSLRACLNDPAANRAIRAGDVGQLQQQPAFRRMLLDAQLSDAARELGLVDNQGNAEDLARLMARAGAAFHALGADPEVRAILEDEDFNRKLQAGSPWALMNDERMLTLMRKLTAVEAAPASSPAAREAGYGDSAASEPAPLEPVEPRKVYRWRDAQGGVHITNEPPPEGAEEL